MPSRGLMLRISSKPVGPAALREGLTEAGVSQDVKPGQVHPGHHSHAVTLESPFP